MRELTDDQLNELIAIHEFGILIDEKHYHRIWLKNGFVLVGSGKDETVAKSNAICRLFEMIEEWPSYFKLTCQIK